MARSKPRDKKPRIVRIPAIILAAVTVACLLPFVGKAFHIDDPLFIWAAQHIRTHPFNPYGFRVNWYGLEMPMSAVTQNPPLACYYIALASLFVGWSEVGIHLFMMIPAVGVILGTYRLAQRWCATPLLAALIALLTPVFLVSSTTVMCDVMMLALWVWATVLWIEGMDGEHGWKLAAASVLIATAALTKYYGATLIPLLLLYSLIKTRRLGWWAAYMLVPVAILGLYELGTHALYGHGLLSSASAYASSYRFMGRSPSQKLLIGLTFIGGCLIPLFFYAPLLWSRRNVAPVAVLIIAFGAWLIHIKTLGFLDVREISGTIHWSPVAQISLYAVVGLAAVILAVTDAMRRRDADSIFLCLWVLSTFLFAALINWSANGRSVLPAVPAIGILIARRMELRSKIDALPKLQWILPPMIFAAIFSMWVAYSDCTFANAERAAAADVCAQHAAESSKNLLIQGHWGFQYYMARAGAQETNGKDCRIIPGEVVAVDSANPNGLKMPLNLLRTIGVIETPVNTGLATMDRKMGAGFYSDQYGPLPFTIGKVPVLRTWMVTPRTPLVFKNCTCNSDHYRTAIKLEYAGNIQGALAEYRAAILLEPDLWGASNGLAWILATNPRYRNPIEAVHWAEIAVRSTHGNQPGVLDTMAVAYASAGRYDEALATTKKAALLAEKQHQPDTASVIRDRIPLYRAHKPYTAPEKSK